VSCRRFGTGGLVAGEEACKAESALQGVLEIVVLGVVRLIVGVAPGEGGFGPTECVVDKSHAAWWKGFAVDIGYSSVRCDDVSRINLRI
jgi:hypothetical protein